MHEETQGDERSPWKTPREAADYLGFTYGTLKTWRARGAGPRYHKVGRQAGPVQRRGPGRVRPGRGVVMSGVEGAARRWMPGRAEPFGGCRRHGR